MKILIDDWRSAWRKLSVQFTALIATYGLLPAEHQQAIMGAITDTLAAVGIQPERIPAVIAFVWLALRLLHQQAAPTERAEEDRQP